MTIQRMGMVIGVKPDRVEEYKALHAAPWPEMDAALSAANLRNYSIYLREPENLLFGYWEYVGTDYAADMKLLGERAVTQALAQAHRSLPGAARDTCRWRVVEHDA
jgi:L-rhamnose mutarotase